MEFYNRMCSKYYTKLLVLFFWTLGLCNNFAYVVMLSAAHDILSNDNETTNGTGNHTTIVNQTGNNKYDCNDVSTGAVLLADIIPGIIIKLIAPFFVHKIKYPVRVSIVVVTAAMSFLIVALTPKTLKFLTFIGVMCASFSSSFGEITFLSLSTLYDQIYPISGWSSGTGMAGLGGSLSYAGLTSAGVTPRDAILIMLFIPVLMVVSYVLLPKPQTEKDDDEETVITGETTDHSRYSSRENLSGSSNSINDEAISFTATFKERLRLVRPLLKYMIPLFLVYFAEYFINQGLFELFYFKNGFISEHKNQYRWYNVCYQLAVFISRSSITLFKVKFLPIFPILQIANVIIVMSQIFYGYMPSIWFAFAIIFWEGLLGGGCYVNAFYLVSIELPKNVREFSIAITSVADSFGITLAGFLAIPVHNAICDYGKRA